MFCCINRCCRNREREDNRVVVIPGPRGPMGSRGPTGPTGATGVTGPTGPTGPSVAETLTVASLQNSGTQTLLPGEFVAFAFSPVLLNATMIGRELVVLRAGYYLLNYGITPTNDDDQLVLFVDGTPIVHAGTTGSKILRLQNGSRLAIGATSGSGVVTLSPNGVNAYLTVTGIYN